MAAGLGAYAHVLADPRARAFSLAGFLARLPLSMTGLGIVLLISLTSGSFGRAGLLVGVVTLSSAVAAPLWGRRIDRVGQARVLVLAALLNSVSLLGLITSVLRGWPFAVALVAAVGVGLGFSSAGASVRARWSHRLGDDPVLQTAYAVEAVLDEVVFIVGPVLATFFATSVHPALGLLASLVLGLTGALLLAGLRDTQPPVGPHSRRRAARQGLSARLLAPVVVASMALGAVFGGMEVVVVAFAKQAGVLAYTGLLVMAWAAGSLVAGVVTGTVVWRASAARRFRWGAAALGLSMVPLPFASHAGLPVLVAALLVLSGLTIAPTLIAAVAVTQSMVPASRLTEALAWTSTGLAGGLALGASALGQVIDHGGATAGFVGMVAVGVLLSLAGLGVRGRGAGVSPAPRGTAAVAAPPEQAGSRPQ